MPEEFLQFIWKNRLFKNNLKTIDGEAIDVLNTGIQNSDSGPDFFNAKIKIGNTIWAGNIEIHTKSSNWNIHNHNSDPSYDNVILHIVEENNIDVFNSKGVKLNTCLLDYNLNYKDNYKSLLLQKQWINCEDKIKNINLLSNDLYLTKLAIERLERKTLYINELLKYNNNNWEETFYQIVARNFGFNTNSLPFELLAKSIPQKIIAKHKDSLFQIKVLLFGQAGFVNNNEKYSDYSKEYSFLKTKYKLLEIDYHLWKFMRVRPNNFPDIRINQFANLLHNSISLFSKIIEIEKYSDLFSLFDLEQENQIGKKSIDNIIINSVIPMLFIYGKIISEQKYIDRSIDLLIEIKPESNSIIKSWNNLNIIAKNSLHSQALIQLKNEYCINNKCLNCYIGTKIINSV